MDPARARGCGRVKGTSLAGGMPKYHEGKDYGTLFFYMRHDCGGLGNLRWKNSNHHCRVSKWGYIHWAGRWAQLWKGWTVPV